MFCFNRFLEKRWDTTDLLYILILFQFVLLKYNPTNHIPSARDFRDGARVIKMVAGYKGDVYFPFHSWYPVMAGKKMFVHKMPIEDVYIGFPEKFPRALIKKIENREFSAIFYDWEIRPDTRNPVEKAIADAYRKGLEIPYAGPHTFMPMTGFKARPQTVYVPVEKREKG